MIKIDVISGFLGAGKTTLIKRLFESKFHNERIVLIENEFGEIGIDGAFLKEAGVEIKEINAGCICCSLVGDFSESMKEVINRFNPERIIVEPSGVGKLSDIVNAISTVDAPLQLNILATVVDGPKTKVYLKNFGEFFNNQVDAADTIIINKVDKMTEEKLEEVVALVKQNNPNAHVITTPISELDPVKLLETLENNVSLKDELLRELQHEHGEECDDPECKCHHHHHHHDEDDDHCCCHDEEHHHHHHHDDEDEEHCCCHHHDHDEEECDDPECECHHHHHHDDEDEEHCCCHHHDHDEEECDDPDCECHHHHHDNGDEEHCCCHHEGHHHHHHHHGHDADEVFTSWGIETAKSVSREQLEHFLNVLAGDECLGIIVRSKGILKASDNTDWYYFDFVSGDFEIRTGSPDVTGKLCVIGSKMDEKRIEEIFRGL